MVRVVFAIVFLAAGPSMVRAQELSAAEKQEGFISLMNGKDFSGWRFGPESAFTETPKNWKVEEGLIRLSGGGSPHLASQWDFDDFDARFEWRAAKKGYNSGFFVRSSRKIGSNQINLAEKAAGNLMGNKNGPGVPELQNPPGQWNEWRVLAQGEKLTFWCNGKQAWEVTNFKTPRGYFGLQAEGAAMDFRNFRVKELGYTPLTFKKGEGSALVTAPVDATNVIVRLEWKAKTPDSVAVAGTFVNLAEEKLKKATNPPGQWNYLQVEVNKDKLRVWMNGVDVEPRDAPTTTPGPIGISGEMLEVQHGRLKKLK
ncbi:MAG: DUF1080 domain-containing protein [Gemmataceae bacterium]|nr:DUF1080 domain-containing protein [Gemmataceae bacterium]